MAKRGPVVSSHGGSGGGGDVAPTPYGGDRYFAALAAAIVRGRLGSRVPPGGPPDRVLASAAAAGLRLHGSKRSAALPRVARVLGIPRGLGPQRVRDIGSGRGAFLWPLLDAFPALPVITVDHDLVER